MDTGSRSAPIGILDSGVGGLSVTKHIRALLPYEDLIYFADQAHVPYGQRPKIEIRRFTEEISNFLLAKKAKLIVLACNTASAAALNQVRETFPSVPFVGMEPAVKPGAEQTANGRIGILATAGTFHSRRYASLMDRFAQGVTIFEDPCPGLVEQIEAGELASRKTEKILSEALSPMLDGGVDTVVLGCTHYPFVLPLIYRLVGPEVSVIDPAPAVARQVKRVLHHREIMATEKHEKPIVAFTSADSKQFSIAVNQLWEQPMEISKVFWHEGEITDAGPSADSSA